MRFAPHNIQEHRLDSFIDDKLILATYLDGGSRIIDFSDRYRPKELGYNIPGNTKKQKVIQTNDVYMDRYGLIYIVDRLESIMHILEFTGPYWTDTTGE